MNLKKLALRITRNGIEAVEPKTFMPEAISYREGEFTVNGYNYEAENFIVIGGGKAAGCMAQELENILGESIMTGEVNTNNPVKCERININQAGHPYPNKGSVQGTKRMLALKEIDSDLIIALISGGGSSLLEIPLKISLEELVGKTKKLVHSGKSIKEINKIRSQFSSVKNGGLVRHFYPRKVVGLILSDVMDNDINTIASGPTDYMNADNFILADNDRAVKAMKNFAEKSGFSTYSIQEKITGEPQTAVKKISKMAKRLRGDKVALIWGGETTPAVKGQGKGGRNQHFALCFLKEFKLSEYDWCFASRASDGQDFVKNVGGGIVTDEMNKAGIDQALTKYDSFNFLKVKGGLIFSKNTGTNVGDLGVLLLKSK